MRLLASLALLLCVAAAPACSSETGILITTTAEQDLQIEFDHFQVFVGERLPIDDPENDPYYTDTEPLEDVQMEARNLADEPYKLLIQPDGNLDAELMVAVVAFSGDEPVGIATLGHPVYFVEGKVAEWEIVLRRFRDGDVKTDTGCVKFFDDNGVLIHLGSPQDADCDLVTADNDCDDFDPNVSPRSPEKCDNGIDDNCNGLIDQEEDADNDEDGFSVCAGDCDDGNPNVNPDAEEKCDGVDNNCNFECDEGFDVDRDNFTTCGTIVEGAFCRDGGPSEEDVDCDDESASTFPGADELCDGKDNDCNGLCDDDDGLDPDGDTFTDCGSQVERCGMSAELVDCAPDDELIHPRAPELCNGHDDNCDGEFAAEVPCFSFDILPDTCFEGRRACDEIDGSFGLGDVCEGFGSDTPLAGDVCSAYESCEDNVGAGEDPLACFVEENPVSNAIQCKVSLNAASQQCSGDTVFLPLPPQGSVQCKWSILGGAEQQGYFIQLADENLNVGGELDVCTGVSVRVSAGPRAGHAHIFISVTDDLSQGAGQLIELDLEPQVVRVCEGDGQPATKGLVCDGLEPGPQITL